MKNTRIDNLGPRRSVGEAPNPETALFLAGTAFGLAMISLLAVLAFADIVELAHLLPFFALPLVLFIASAPLIRRWVKGEAGRGSRQGSRPSLIEATVSEGGAHRDRWPRREATCAQTNSGDPTMAGAAVSSKQPPRGARPPKNGHRRREGN
jgi:hypothetical protein